MNGDHVTYFYSFGVKYFPKEIKKIINNKNITSNNIYKIQANDFIIFVFYLLTLCFKVKVYWIIPIYVLLMNMKRIIK